MNRNKHIRQRSFHCHKLFYCSSCPTAAPASLNMHVVSTNLAKTLVVNLNMTSYCDVINNVYPVTMTTIRNFSILAFGRGASNQALAPGITRPLHAAAFHVTTLRTIFESEGLWENSSLCCIVNYCEIIQNFL